MEIPESWTATMMELQPLIWEQTNFFFRPALLWQSRPRGKERLYSPEPLSGSLVLRGMAAVGPWLELKDQWTAARTGIRLQERPHGVMTGRPPRRDRRRSEVARSTTAEMSRILQRRSTLQSGFLLPSEFLWMSRPSSRPSMSLPAVIRCGSRPEPILKISILKGRPLPLRVKAGLKTRLLMEETSIR